MCPVKIISFDDFCHSTLNHKYITEKCNLTLAPTASRCGNTFFIDILDPDLSKYYHQSRSCSNTVIPSVSSRIMLEMFERSYNLGYGAVIVICPHSSVLPHHRNAVNAKRCFMRQNHEDDFRIEVLDAKSVGTGMLVPAIYAAKQAENCIDTDSIINLSRRIVKKGEMIYISKNGNSTVINNICGNDIETVDVSLYRKELQLKAFLYLVTEKINAGKHKAYAISTGCNLNSCSLDTVISEIDERSGCEPLFTLPYSLIGTYMFGDNALCVNFFNSDYFDFEELKKLAVRIKLNSK